MTRNQKELLQRLSNGEYIIRWKKRRRLCPSGIQVPAQTLWSMVNRGWLFDEQGDSPFDITDAGRSALAAS